MSDFRIACSVLLAALTLLKVSGQSNTCRGGWFGSHCQYQCRCARNPNCEYDGRCIRNGACQISYFGPACQYYDIKWQFTDPSRTPGFLHDLYNQTCNPDPKSESVNLLLYFRRPASWFRIITNGYGVPLLRFTMVINRNQPCSHERRYVISSSVVDVECQLMEDFGELTIHGDLAPYICNIQISKGRAIALGNQTGLSVTSITEATPCPENRFGLGCEKHCSCGQNEICSPITGTCRLTCPAGRFGPLCAKECNNECVDRKCDPQSGICYHCKNASLGDYCGTGRWAATCDAGWFGPKCEFRCACKTSHVCDLNGICPGNGRCKDFYFGPSCQYLDAASFFSDSRIPAFLTDRNDQTCNPDRESKSVTLHFPVWVSASWIRITTKPIGSTQLKFSLVVGYVFRCINEKRYLMDPDMVMIECDEPLHFNELTIRGEIVPHICSIQISGDRQIALKQFVNQTSTYVAENSKAANAIDGINNSKGLCVRTNSGPEQKFTMYFDSPPKWLLRVRVFNTDDRKLNGFTTWAYNQKGVPVLVRVIEAKLPHEVYEIPMWSAHSVAKLELQITNSYLHFCEIEVFGDNACPENTYGLFCEHRCYCGQYETCSRVTGICILTCPAGRFGQFCTKECSSNCMEGKCDSQSGICYHCKNLDYCGTGYTALASTMKTEIGPPHLWAVISAIIVLCSIAVVVFFYMGMKKKTKRNQQANTGDMESTDTPPY